MNSYGKIIGGNFDNIIIREKRGSGIELGDLLISESGNSKMLLQVFALNYGSQLSQQSLELVSGLNLEENSDLEFFDEDLRAYHLALAKPLLEFRDGKVLVSKRLPPFMSDVRLVEEQDLNFLVNPHNKFFVGKLRSGSKVLDLNISLDSSKILKHHILIAATTGRGKSNLAKVLVSNLVDEEDVAMLVFDPHDEYYGRNGFGLKDYAEPNSFVYYTPSDTPLSRKLLFNLKSISPFHINIEWSGAQRDAIFTFYKKYGPNWISSLLLDKPVDAEINDMTLAVVKRKLKNLLGLRVVNGSVVSDSIFVLEGAENTVKDIISALEDAKIVVIDTSTLSDDVELLINSMIASEIFSRYKYYKTKGILDKKPVVSILLEEAPRVLNNDSLLRKNIFSTIAREGRKFKIGLIAITQLPSLIPREILANMNTKIILGIEMEHERQAIINSASQDLSSSSQSIASLDIGEALITSSFVKFAIPVKIPEFKEYVKSKNKPVKTNSSLVGFN